MSLNFVNDPGRRNHSLVGPRHLRNIIDLRVISESLLLVHLGSRLLEEKSYWTLLTIERGDKKGGMIVEIHLELNE